MELSVVLQVSIWVLPFWSLAMGEPGWPPGVFYLAIRAPDGKLYHH
jgi:hypothetical protein